jgi:hypothetical protein
MAEAKEAKKPVAKKEEATTTGKQRIRIRLKA